MKRQKTEIDRNEVSECEPSSPGKISVTKKLSYDQKKDKKRIKLYFQHCMVRSLERQLWKKFDLMQNIKKEDLLECVKASDADILYSDCLQYLCKDHNFVEEANMIHLKDDALMLVNLFRLYSLH